jgi:hypothetical protein
MGINRELWTEKAWNPTQALMLGNENLPVRRCPLKNESSLAGVSISSA